MDSCSSSIFPANEEYGTLTSSLFKEREKIRSLREMWEAIYHTTTERASNEEDGENDEMNVIVVMYMAQCSRPVALQALEKCNNDIIDAVILIKH